MRTRSIAAWLPFALVAGSACGSPDNSFLDSGRRRDGAATDTRGGDVPVLHDTGPTVCVDSDGDGIADGLESPADDDHDGTPNTMDTDSDGDGFSDADESVANYPGFTMMRAPLSCGQAADDCDMDATPNFRDLDSDNDGLTDAEESTAHTNPCNTDTDGDGIDDLTERVAMSSPTDPMSRPPAGSLYVTLPYHPPGEMGDHPMREFTFATRIRLADVFFLVDNSASMQPIINTLRMNFSATIVPGVRAAIPDVRMGVASFDSIPDGIDGESGHPGDFTLWVRQKLDANAALTQTAFNNMHTIDTDTSMGYFGGDYPEDQTEALFEAIQGDGMTGHITDALARRSVHNGLDATGNGWVPRMDPAMDCDAGPDSPTPFGWACFSPGRVPILVLASDASWYNGFAPGSPIDPNSHTSAQLLTAMMAHGAYFIGVDVGDTPAAFGNTLTNATPLARSTGTLDAAGQPIAFHPGSAGISMAASQIVSAITTIAGQSRQDITTRTDSDTAESRLMPPHVTRDFVRAVTPARGIPEAPMGYDRHDMRTFFNVAPSTQVVFNVDFYNDFQPGGMTAQVFRAQIVVLGRAGTEVDHRDVFIVVPAAGGQPPG